MELALAEFETVCNNIIEHFTAKCIWNPKLSRNSESGIFAWNLESWPKFCGSRNLIQDF